jgi:hypothetical protein
LPSGQARRADRRSDFDRRPGEQAAEPARRGDVPLLLVQSDRVLARRCRRRRAVCEPDNLGEIGRRLGTTLALWLAVPLLVGLWRITRGEIR